MSNDRNDRFSDGNNDEGRHHEAAIAAAWREAVDSDPGEAPPASLDAHILAAARAAVQPAPRRPRYAVPLALAATLVIAVGLGLQQRSTSLPPPDAAVVGRAVDTVDAEGPGEAAGQVAADMAPAGVPDSPTPASRVTAASRLRAESKADETPPTDAAAGASRAEPARESMSLPAPPAAPAASEVEAHDAVDAMSLPEGTRLRAPAVPALPTPEAALEAIRAVLARGERAEAAALVRAFQQRYPQFPLPPDLAPLSFAPAR